ncbi:MAG TPA: ABC transporter permease [Candidatus Dormibacteraeota bacterium]|nr:ABC transporter permease [Candidatus Dormibacteraeota bacterium]
MKRLGKHAIFYAALLGSWSLLAALKIWPPYLLPAPKGVMEALYAGFQDHSFWIAIAVSMRRVLIGYGISVVAGTVLGLGVASNKFLEETMGGLLVSLQSLPSICWWPLALLWFGLNQNAILFVVIMGSLLSVTMAMEDGRKQMPKIYAMAGRNLGARGFRLFWYVLLPASLPFIVSGLKQGWAFAWRSLITAEMLYMSLGLGQVLMMGRELNDMSQVIAVMILIIAIGYVVDGLVFKTIERRLQHQWGLTPAT